MEEILDVAKVNDLGGITIPIQIRKALGIRPKDYVVFINSDNKITIRKRK